METLSDLNTFAKILLGKGYNGYFHTQGAHPGKLKDSITEYLTNQPKVQRKMKDRELELRLTCYLQWAGEGKSYVFCSMLVKHLNGKFFLNRMEIEKKDQFGQLLKMKEIKDLTVITAPSVTEAIALINE